MVKIFSQGAQGLNQLYSKTIKPFLAWLTIVGPHKKYWGMPTTLSLKVYPFFFTLTIPLVLVILKREMYATLEMSTVEQRCVCMGVQGCKYVLYVPASVK